jgi:RNA polymerase-associated protein LEO1
MSLYLGTEIFEIQDQHTMPNLHLFTRQGASLQAQSAFKRKFTFRPHSTDTLTHRKMTLNMADKSNRTQKVKMVTDVGMNPEKARAVSSFGLLKV